MRLRKRRQIDLEAWKALARRGEAPRALLFKQQTAEVKAVEGSDRKVAFTISTGSVDRDRDTISVEGWKLAKYRRNPVVLWAHQRTGLPIAKAEDVRIEDGVLRAVAEFVPADMNPLAESVLRMLKAGFLRATSVGFIPVDGKYKWNEKRGGIDFEQQELLEFSVVPVPANAEALSDSKGLGLDVLPLKSWAEEMLLAFGEPKLGELLVAELVKRGRTLSAANEERIRTARDASSAIAAALDEVLVQVAEPPATDDDASKAPVFFVSPAEPKYLVDQAVVVAATQAAVSEAVREGVNFARGRLD